MQKTMLLDAGNMDMKSSYSDMASTVLFYNI